MILPLEIGLPAIDVADPPTIVEVRSPLSSFHYQATKVCFLLLHCPVLEPIAMCICIAHDRRGVCHITSNRFTRNLGLLSIRLHGYVFPFVGNRRGIGC